MDCVVPKMSRLRKVRAFFNDLPTPLFSVTGQRHSSDLAKVHSERIFQLLRETPLSRSELQTIQTLLSRCPRQDNFLEPLDDKGWNLLQKAIISNQLQVVSMLIDKGCDLNAGVCSLPLHLACKLGHANIVQLLLDHGAKADLSRGLCYPVSHHLKPSGSGKPPKFLCHQVRVAAPPLSYAIPNDRDEAVRVLLTHRNSKDVVKKELLLHEVCKYRARRCLKLLVEMLPEQVNMRDKKGITPLHHALRGPRNRDSAVILLQSKAHFLTEIFETEYGTLLHELYVSDDTTHLLQLTRLMLDKGPPELATRVMKADGDTVLNKLLKFFGGSTPRDRDQYVREVTATIRILIARGCDPNQVNKKGECALHALLTHHSGRPLFYIRDQFGVGPAYLSTLLANTCTLMEVLLQSRANANLMVPPYVVSPLYYLMRVICAMSPHLLSVTAEQVKACIRVLCSHGADPNLINAFDDNTMTLLLGSLSRWLYHASDDQPRLETLLTFTEDVLRLFLKHGLNPQLVLRKNLKQFVIIFNSKILDAAFVRHLNQLLKIVVCAGGNPNLIRLNELHAGSEQAQFYVTKYTVGYYLARGLYIHARYQNFSAFHILHVFSNTLYQPLLAQCINSICTNLDEEFEQGAHNALIQNRVKAVGQSPRRLKQLARIAIFVAVRWKLDANCPLLPLPKTLIGYLTNIE